MDYDALMLSRIQFAFTVAFHILFPAFTIGLASYLAVLEAIWLRTKKERFKTLYLFWVKIFAISFGMGVVSGIVMSYQFGTNWAEFSRLVAPTIGPVIAYEILTAFFLEAAFIGVMLFGWQKVGNRLHFLATCLVAIGTMMSAFWIIAANSWMQTPAGFEVMADGRIRATNYFEVIFNPSFLSRFLHQLWGAFLTTALVVAGVSAWHLLRRDDSLLLNKTALAMAVGLVFVFAPLQIVWGHQQGELIGEYQPSKLAAMEGVWETGPNQPWHIAAWPNRDIQGNEWEISIPWGMGSLIAKGSTDATIVGLKEWAREDQPPVWPVFWSFRVMVGAGLLMLLFGLWGAWLLWRRKLFTSRPFLWFAILMSPMGFVAILTGWFTAEIGRQPWVVYNVLRTRDAVSPVPAEHVSISLLSYFVIYAIVFTAGSVFIFRLLREGPAHAVTDDPAPTPRGPNTALAAAPEDIPGDERPLNKGREGEAE